MVTREGRYVGPNSGVERLRPEIGVPRPCCNADERATAIQLSDYFKAGGVEAGEVREKSIRFFLAAMKEAGVQYSPHLEKRGAKTIASRGARSRKAGNGRPASQADPIGTEAGSDEDMELAGMTRWPIPIPGKATATIIVPADIDTDDWSMITNVVNAYITLGMARSRSAKE